jgi:hypothetical protein
MKVVAALQIIFGGMMAWSAWFLADKKGYEIIHQPGTVWNPPPDMTLEIALTILSLTIFGLAMAQAVKKVKLAGWQVICGVTDRPSCLAERAHSATGKHPLYMTWHTSLWPSGWPLP